MQLRRTGRPACVLAGVLLAAVLAPGEPRADGELAMRGVYYKEKASRVVQPMLDARLDIDTDTEIEIHALVDAITSASVAAGAGTSADGTPEVIDNAFSEQRYETGAALSRRMGRNYLCGISGRVSYEPDYQSVSGGARCQVELAQRNTTLGLALSQGRDQVSDANARSEMSQGPGIEGTLTTSLVSASLTQVLSPVMLAGVTYDLIYMNGFLENPYRQVTVGGGAGGWERERLPDSRLRHAIVGSTRGFLPSSKTTLIAGYRLYSDDWGIVGHTPEARLVQELTRDVEVQARYRFHWQSKADFYDTAYDTGDELLEPYITDDVKLSHFTTHTVGMEIKTALWRMGVTGALRDARLDLVIEYVVQNNRFGNAILAQTALTVPLAY